MAQDVTLTVGGDTGALLKEVDRALKLIDQKLAQTGRAGGKSTQVLGSGLSSATAEAQKFDKSMNAAYARVLAFGASAGIINKVTQAFSSLVQSTIGVEKSLKDINVILGASVKGLEKFGSGLFKVAKDTGQSFEVVASAATELSRQGLSAEKTLQRTKDAMILARLAGMDAVGAVEALTATLNTFNKSGLDSTKVVNKLAKVDAAFAVSSQDLAQALQRVGASAQGAGVSFDELLAIVTAAQQKTARGGAVIGNSFKTIFTRIQRPEVLNQLERLGIAVKDVEGNTLPAIRILGGLARTFDHLTDSQKSVVSEQVAGVFQINILKAALGDLNSQYSIYQGALRASSSATNEATQRNAELNTTISALLNKTTQSFKELSSVVGNVTIAPAIKNILQGVNEAMQGAMSIAGTEAGATFMKGIGKFLAGPGLAVVGLFTGKLLAGFATFATEAISVLSSRKAGEDAVGQSAQSTLATYKQQLLTIRQITASQAGGGIAAKGKSRGRAVGNFALATTPVRAGGDGMIPNFAAKGKMFRATGLSGRLGVLAGQGASGSSTYTASATSNKIPAALSKGLQAGGYSGVEIPNVQQRSILPQDARSERDLSRLMTNPVKSGIANVAKGMVSHLFKGGDDKAIARKEIDRNKKSIILDGGTQGGIQEAAARLFLGTGKNPYQNLNPQAIFDFEDTGPPSKMFRKFFNFPEGLVKADSKRTIDSNSRHSIISKAFNDRSTNAHFSGLNIEPTKKKGQRARVKKGFEYVGNSTKATRIPGYAKALMPNFSALGEAVSREKAAGIPSSAIRIGSSSQLATSGNPKGLAVYNTIDEPRGLSQGISRYTNAGLDPRSAGTPNFAKTKQLDGSGGFSMAGIAGSMGLSMLSASVDNPTMSGAAQGASLGVLMGPWGAAIGGVIGGLVGFTKSLGDNSKEIALADERRATSLAGLTSAESALQEISNGNLKEAAIIYSKLNPETQDLIGGFDKLNASALNAAKNFISTRTALENINFQIQKRENSSSGVAETIGDIRSRIGSAMRSIGKAGGGMIRGGSGVRDDVPAMLTGGEFVVKKSAVDSLGVGFMNRINSYGGKAGGPRNFQDGGPTILPGTETSATEAKIAASNENGVNEIVNAIKNLGEIFKFGLNFKRETGIGIGGSFEGLLDIETKRAMRGLERKKDVSDLNLKEGGMLANAAIGGARVGELLPEVSKGMSQAEVEKTLLKGARDRGDIETALLISKEISLMNEDNVQGYKDQVEQLKKINDQVEKLQAKIAKPTFSTKFRDGFFGEMEFDQLKFALESGKELAAEMKGSFQGAFKSFIDGSENASGAFRSFANSVLDKMLDISLSYGTNSLFSALGTGANKAFNFGYQSPQATNQKARGGMIRGGSGVRDDVPAMLTGGEFVVKKSAVDSLGVGFMNRINSYAEGGVVAENEFQKGTLGTKGKYNVSSRMSALAITSNSNPQNALRGEMQQSDEQRVSSYEQYIQRKRDAMAAFKAQKSQKRTGAMMSAAISIGAAGLSKYMAGTPKGMAMAARDKASAAKSAFEERSYGMAMTARSKASAAKSAFESRAQGGSMSTSIAPVKPMGTSASSAPMSFGGGGGGGSAMLVASIQQLSASIQSGGSAGGGGTNVNLTFNIDKSGNAGSEQGSENKTGQPSSSGDQEKEKQFGETIKSVVLDTISKQKRPGGLLFKAS